MHFFIAGKVLKNALSKFRHFKSKSVCIRAASANSIEMFSGLHATDNIPYKLVRIWLEVPTTREIDCENFGSECFSIRALSGLKSAEVEIEADCFGFHINGEPREDGLLEQRINDLRYPDVAEKLDVSKWPDHIEITKKDCDAISWARNAVSKDRSRGFDNIRINDGTAESTDGNMLIRAAITNKSGEIFVNPIIADAMSQYPGTLHYCKGADLIASQFVSDEITVETSVKQDGIRWPDFDRAIPFSAPSICILAPYILEHIKSAVEGYDIAQVLLSIPQGKRDIHIVGIKAIQTTDSLYDGLLGTDETRSVSCLSETPSRFDYLNMGVLVNARFIMSALAGFKSYVDMHYGGDEGPLLFKAKEGLSVVMPMGR